MGYCVTTSGWLQLSEAEERRLVPLLRDRMLQESGWLDVEDEVSTLDDLGAFAGTRCRRDGDRLVLAEDHRADPKWSEQANAFWCGVGEVVTAGVAVVEGEDGQAWRYDFTPGGLVQTGRNGWDGARHPDGTGEGEWDEAEEDLPAPSRPVLEPTPARVRLYTVCGVVPALAGGAMLAVGNGSGLLPLALGGLNLAVAARLRSRGQG